MSRPRPDRFAMTTLRGDLPAASMLTVLLLLAQLLIAGLGAGAALGSVRDRDLCTAASDTVEAHRDAEDHGGPCPCLAAGCCAAPIGTPPPEGAALSAKRVRPVLGRKGQGVFADPERRPLALFARAGRGPPSVS